MALRVDKMKLINDLIFNIKYKYFTKTAKITPKGECFALYCKNIIEDVEQATIENYENTINNVINSVSDASIDRKTVAAYFYTVLSDLNL